MEDLGGSEAFGASCPSLGLLIERDRERGRGGYQRARKAAERVPGVSGAVVATGWRKRLM